jgi:hypothetical protein
MTGVGNVSSLRLGYITETLKSFISKQNLPMRRFYVGPHILRISENRVLRKIFVPQWDEGGIV